jgi:hypothetical protein
MAALVIDSLDDTLKMLTSRFPKTAWCGPELNTTK